MKTPRLSLNPWLALVALVAAASLAGCGPGTPPPSARQLPPPPPLPIQPPPATAEVRLQASQRGRQAEFLNRLRQADPQFKVIDRALLNEQNELGLILDRSVAMDDIPALMRTMLTQMAKEFPNQDLTVVAYTPSNPPRRIGTATLNAQSREMKFTHAQP